MPEPTSTTGAAGAALVAIGVSLVGSKYGPFATVAAGGLLGAASYSLYLVHPLVMDTVRPVGDVWPWLRTANLPGLGIAMAASVGIAVGLHKWVELPLVRAARGLLAWRAGKRAAVVPAAGMNLS